MRSKASIATALFLLTQLCLRVAIAGTTLPAELPRPDGTPPATDKPVKVYILSGQSNMFGFGMISGASPVHAGIFLSADPGIMPCKMPVGASALLPHHVWKDAKSGERGATASVYRGAYDPAADDARMEPAKQVDVPLGTVAAELPAIDGPHTVVVKAWIEVPMSGTHQVHVGQGDSSYAVAVLDGKEVYRKEVGGVETVTDIRLESGRRYPLTVTYLKGGSATFWMELVGLKGKGDLDSVVRDEGKFPWLVDANGEWVVRKDVMFTKADGRGQPLSPKANGRNIGPELGFGHVMGTFHDEPVILIKASIGNRSLGWDILPPGSKPYEFEDKTIPGYRGTKDNPQGTGQKPEKGWYAGKTYDRFTASVHSVLDRFGELYPEYKDQGYEIAGFVWWQGHKDGGSEAHISHYEQNLVRLIKVWRKEFNAPDAKWTIATVGFGGDNLNDKYRRIADAQLAVSGDAGKYPEFAGNVKTIDTRPFWRTQAESPSGKGYHYNLNAETYMLAGDALGRAMVELMDGEAESIPASPCPEPVPDKPVDEMTLEEMARLIYSTPYLSTWSRDEREPTPEQYAAMAPALRPFIVGKVVPEYVARAPKVPAYRRHGLSIETVVNADPLKTAPANLRSQLDYVISCYNAAGIHDYDWKPFGPEMQTGTWHYFSFDPPETQQKSKSGRNREITFPEGMEDWYAVDFDPQAAGWKTGRAPFGQKNGKQEAVRAECTNPHCGCDITPKTLWEKEVLLMRQTFAIPELNENRRYRIVLGGSGHRYSGEGFSIYVNGKLFAERTSGFDKRGGVARGGYISRDFLPEFKSGKVTIAVKGFLRYTHYNGRAAPPRGHLSVWLEEARLPDIVLQTLSEKR